MDNIPVTLSAAAVATVVSTLFNWWVNTRKEKQRLRAACKILMLDVNRNVYGLRQASLDNLSALRHDPFPDNPNWEKLKFELFGLPPDEFDCLIEHYTNMLVVHKWLEFGSDNLAALPERLLSPKIADAEKALAVLQKHSLAD